jgi:hypothetical protein
LILASICAIFAPRIYAQEWARIERSTFHPLEVPQLIEESFDQILATAKGNG